MSREKTVVLSSLVMVVMVALGACGPAPATVVVQETVVVAGTSVAAEQAATATVEPAPTEPVPTEPPLTEPPPTEPLPAETAEPEGLWYPIDGDPETLDYSADYGIQTERVIQQCIEGLFEYRGDGTIEAAAASGLEVSEDGRVYTITLREDAVWSDGEPVIAQHYVDHFFLLEAPGGMGHFFERDLVEGLEAYTDGETGDPATVGVRAVDDHTLEIRLAEPAAYFETILARDWYPIRLDLIETHGEAWTELDNYVCNSAYLIEDWVRGDRVVFVKNPDYWNADQVAIERLTFVQVPDAVASYENDELHVLSSGIDWREEAERIFADPVLSRQFQVVPAVPGLQYIALNTVRPPTDDVRVRKALALAFDKEAFLDEIMWSEAWQPTSCAIPPSVMGHQPQGSCGHEYDPEGARALLAEAGYPDGKGLPTLHLWVDWEYWEEDALRIVAAQWEETLGITTEVHTIDWETYQDYLDECRVNREALAACELNSYSNAWRMRYGDPQYVLEVVFAPDSTLQYTGWENERYDELLALARAEPDTARRVEYYKEADKILVEEEAVVIPLLYIQKPVLVKDGVTYEFPPFVPEHFKRWALP
jgi:oligopeptide transport system substrate-binding protein